MKNIRVIQTAIAQLGTREDPPGSNRQPFGRWYGLDGAPWCAIFVSWAFHHAGMPLGRIDRENGMQYCPSALQYFKKAGRVTGSPAAGDIVFFDWEGDGRFDHTGLFLQDNRDGTFISLEGNTGMTNDSNGGEVMIRLRKYRNAVFVHPQVYDNP